MDNARMTKKEEREYYQSFINKEVDLWYMSDSQNEKRERVLNKSSKAQNCYWILELLFGGMVDLATFPKKSLEAIGKFAQEVVEKEVEEKKGDTEFRGIKERRKSKGDIKLVVTSKGHVKKNRKIKSWVELMEEEFEKVEISERQINNGVSWNIIGNAEEGRVSREEVMVASGDDDAWQVKVYEGR